ncbi:hypothetical protein [Actinoplanes solisilvae]|uniref:hypothetical protein n=1 Tax=Actinoplanes solisilvae TaxID=2486853 RepID=UPI000FDC3D93|nr:hypothetical protein [Actinoplanes solisilvae]
MDVVLAAVKAAYGTTALPGLASGLVVRELDGWTRASELDPRRLVDAAQRRWEAPPHVAVALLWRAYALWLSVPAAFGWVAARRVPLLGGGDVLVRLDAPIAPVRLGLRSSELVPASPAVLRRTLLDEHVLPVLDGLQSVVRISRRILLGSLAAGVAHAARHAVRVVPGTSTSEIGTLLAVLGLDDLLDWSADEAGLVSIRRRTCCLAFMLPQPRFCGDCCVLPTV